MFSEIINMICTLAVSGSILFLIYSYTIGTRNKKLQDINKRVEELEKNQNEIRGEKNR